MLFAAVLTGSVRDLEQARMAGEGVRIDFSTVEGLWRTTGDTAWGF
jgi:hypothetical protein